MSSFAGFSQWAYTTNNTSNYVTTAFGKVLASDGLSSNTNGLYASTDNGATWLSSNTGVLTTGIMFGTNDGTNLYAFRNNTVFVSITGNNWTAQASTMASTLIIKSMTVLNGSVIASASPNSPVSFKIFQLNAGTWGLKSLPINSAIVTSIRNLGGTLYTGTTNSSVIKSADAGVTWTGGLTGMPTENINKLINCLASSGSTLLCGTMGGKIVRSTDNGSTLSTVYNIGDNNGFYGINDFYIHNTSTYFAATDSDFVYTANGGTSWQCYNTGLNFSNFENLMTKLTVSGSYIIASVKNIFSGRMVRLPLNQIIVGAGVNENTAGNYENKVYPNPASQETSIEVSDLTFENNCIVIIHDALSKEVFRNEMINGKSKINVEQFAKGIYTFTVDQNNITKSRGKLVVN